MTLQNRLLRVTAAAVSVFLFITGCSRDPGATLDDFSRTSARFLNQEFDTRVAMYLPVLREGSGYRDALLGALNPRVTNRERLALAKNAQQEYETVVTGYMERYASRMGELDTRVLELIEVANAIGSAEQRREAAALASTARKIQSSHGALYKTYGERFQTQLKMLNEIIAGNGALPAEALIAATSPLRVTNEEASRMQGEIEAASVKLNDMVAGLKGKTGTTAVPTKLDMESANQPR